MSCARNSKKVAAAAAGAGISSRVSQRAFSLGAAGLLGGLLLARHFVRQYRLVSALASVRRPATASRLGRIQVLAGQERVEPLAAGHLVGRRCAGCQAAAERKSGLWYNIGGQSYCQDCAPGRAKNAGVSLAVPAPSTSPSSGPGRQLPVGRRIRLKPGWVNLGAIKNLDGYSVVLSNERPTGLTISPGFKVEGDGQVTIIKDRWFVNYDLAGKPLAGPYDSLNQAKGMAALLAALDWNRPMQDFAAEEVRLITALENSYRAGIEDEKLLKQHAMLVAA